MLLLQRYSPGQPRVVLGWGGRSKVGKVSPRLCSQSWRGPELRWWDRGCPGPCPWGEVAFPGSNTWRELFRGASSPRAPLPIATPGIPSLPSVAPGVPPLCCYWMWPCPDTLETAAVWVPYGLGFMAVGSPSNPQRLPPSLGTNNPSPSPKAGEHCAHG